MHLKKDFREFVELLNAEGVKYLVTGAYAVAFHGIPRYTKDIDFFVEPSGENAAKLLSVLRQFGFGSLNISVDDFTQPDKVIQLGVDPVRIDLLTGIEGVTFGDAYPDRCQVEVDGVLLTFLSREHLIRNKRTAGRPQDLADAARLEDLDQADG